MTKGDFIGFGKAIGTLADLAVHGTGIYLVATSNEDKDALWMGLFWFCRNVQRKAAGAALQGCNAAS